MYRIVIKNRTYRFFSVETALAAAADIFRATGSVVGIEKI